MHLLIFLLCIQVGHHCPLNEVSLLGLLLLVRVVTAKNRREKKNILQSQVLFLQKQIINLNSGYKQNYCLEFGCSVGAKNTDHANLCF